jgi:HK97 family phage prohead protease/HK97 family phage major capsid protein
MPMAPHKGESQSDFSSRCVPEMMGDGKRDQEQAVAICLDIWRQAHGGSKPKQIDIAPEDDESEEEFMDRCQSDLTEQGMDDDAAETACETAWENRKLRGPSPTSLVHKTHEGAHDGAAFVLSDESIDRMGDVIMSDGWRLDSFLKNPIALFNHTANFPIGKWRNLRVQDKALVGDLVLAPKGTSARIDEIIKLVEAGILKAVSVGFKPIKHEPLDEKDPWGGARFLEQELVETSLVAVPANANALAIAKSLHVSPETIDLCFAKHGARSKTEKQRAFTAKHGKTPHNGKGGAMSLSQRIADVQTKIVAYSDELDAHLEHINDDNVSDADMQKTRELNAKIAQHEALHETLVESEKRLARRALLDDDGNNGRRNLPATVTVAANGGGGATIASPAVIVGRRKELAPLEYLVRAGTAAVRSKEWGRPLDEVRQRIYGDDEMTKVVTDIVMKAASAPAMTTVAGWAQELAQQKYADLMPLLMPTSVFLPLSAKGLSLSFGQAAKIVIPTRSRTPTIAGSFVGEGNAIPVRQGAFTSQTLVPKKVAVISVFTREMEEHSTPAIEGLIREAIQQDTSVAVDSVLLDANPATAVRPAGLLNGVAALTATAGGGFAAIVGDIKALQGALTTSLYGNVRAPAWLLNPTDVLGASLITGPNFGQFLFRDELERGTLNTIPVIKSSTVPVKTMILIDAADFVSVGGDSIRMELSDQATLHMEDTAPTDLASGSPAVVASPQRSLWQTDSIGLRMVMPLNWLIRRAGTVAWTQNVTWS